MKTYTPEEKKEYFAGLRARWQEIKTKLDEKQIDEIRAVMATHGMNFSPWSYAFTKQSMNVNGFDGIPYLDCKTFHKWKESGFSVKRGERSKIEGITWVSPKGKDGEDDEAFRFPKAYHLFHRSQVEASEN